MLSTKDNPDLSKRAYFVLFSAWFLLFFVHLWEAELKLDGMTYAAIARNILETHDWKTLHYSDFIYKDFYQHPPLAFWLQAIFFKIFGVNIYVVKVFNALIALLTLVTLNIISRVAFNSLWLGFLSSLVLLTSTRWVKFASDFYLDNLLSLFLILGFLSVSLFLKTSQTRIRVLSIITYGITLSAAILTKGLVAFVSPVALIASSFFLFIRNRWQDKKPDKKSNDSDSFLVIALFGSLMGGLMITLWLLNMDGLHYVQEYWKTSVAYRLSAPGWKEHFIPIKHLLTVWWPWWPLMVYSSFRILFNKNTPSLLVLATVVSWGIVLGFSLVGHIIEFYFLPFYVFGALIVGSILQNWTYLSKHRLQSIQCFEKIIFAMALVAATLPISLHGKRASDFQQLITVALEQCSSSETKNILVSPKSGYIWHLLAYIQWETPWQGLFPNKIPQAGDHQLLIVHQDEMNNEISDLGWRFVPTGIHRSIKLFQPAKMPLCKE